MSKPELGERGRIKVIEMNTIDIVKIEKACISGFQDYLLANPIKNVIVVDFKMIFFKANSGIDAISELYNKGKVKINFDAQYELFKNAEFGGVANFFVKTSFASGYLRVSDDNSLHFEIDSVSFYG